MADENLHLTTEYETDVDWAAFAREIVADWIVRGLGVDETFSTYTTWFGFVLGNPKVMISTTIADGRYYEVTFNMPKGEAYLDTYKKTHNQVVTITRTEDPLTPKKD